MPDQVEATEPAVIDPQPAEGPNQQDTPPLEALGEAEATEKGETPVEAEAAALAEVKAESEVTARTEADAEGEPKNEDAPEAAGESPAEAPAEIEEPAKGQADDEQASAKSEAAAEKAPPEPPKPLPPEVEALRKAKEEGAPVEGRVIGWNQGGFHVVIDGITAFCPRSEMELRNPRSPSFYLDNTYRFRVIKHQKRGRRIVLSRKLLLADERHELAAETLAKLIPGSELTGRISSLTDFGAFVDLGGVEGLVHLSELSRRRIAHPREVVKVGQEVSVRVLKVEQDGKRVSLSIKALEPDPWEDFARAHPRGERFAGKVVRKTEFGIFVELQPGLDGMIHLSQLPAGMKTDDPALADGEKVSGWVLKTEPDRQRISLSMREVPAGDPWDGAVERYPEGKVLEGEVEEVTRFGAFIVLEPGLTGLLPKPELGVARGQDPARVFAPGRKVRVQIATLEPKRKRISLVREGSKFAGSKSDYKDYVSRQKKAEGESPTAMAAAFAKVLGDRE